MKKLIRILLLFISTIFISANLFAGNTQLTKDYEKFRDLFKKKKFSDASMYLSSYDYNFFREVKKFDNKSEDDFEVDTYIIEKLKEMWINTYDTKKRENHLKDIQKMLKRDMPEMQKTLEEMQLADEDPELMTGFKKYIENLKGAAKKEMILTKAESDIFGRVLDIKIRGNFAVLVYELKFNFKNVNDDSLKKLEKILAKEKKDKDIYKIDYKTTEYKKAVISNFVKEDGIWKIMLFSTDQFEYDGFRKIIKKYGDTIRNDNLEEGI